MISSDNITEYALPTTKYCSHCGRTSNLKTVYVRSANYTRELTYCEACWNKIVNCLERRGK